MIKKIFIGILLAGAFGLLVLGAVNRTLAKSAENEPLAISKNKSEEKGVGIGNQGQNQSLNADSEDFLPGGRNAESRTPSGGGQGNGITENPANGTGFQGGNRTDTGNGQGSQPEGAPTDRTGTGIAEVEEWLTVTGTVESTSADLWVINLTEGGMLEIEGRLLSYLLENGFSVSPEDFLSITGFMEGDAFEVGAIENTTTNESISVREVSGRPLWAGGRRGGNTN